MKDRVIGAVFVVLLTLVMLLPGGVVSAIVLNVVSLIGLYEFYRVYSLEKSILSYVGYLGTIVFYVLLYMGKETFLFPTVIILLMIVLACYVFVFPKYKDKDVKIEK